MAVPLDLVEEQMKRKGKTQLSIGVAVDGSQMSDRAATVAGSFCKTRRGDKLSIMHVCDSSKGYLPRNLQPGHLKNYYQDLAAGVKVGLKADWVCREKEEGRSTCATLTGLASKQGCDILVLGSFGRKGEKLDILGSVADSSLRSANTSICIVRSTGNKFDKAATFVFATDGSHAAAVAFLWLVNFLARPLDMVHVCMVSTTDGVLEQKFVQQYKSYLEAHNVPGSVTVKCIDRTSMTVPDGILAAAKELDADVLVLGISGFGQKKLGSVSEDLSVRAPCTTLVIKDAWEVCATRYAKAGAGTLAREVVPQAANVASH